MGLGDTNALLGHVGWYCKEIDLQVSAYGSISLLF